MPFGHSRGVLGGVLPALVEKALEGEIGPSEVGGESLMPQRRGVGLQASQEGTTMYSLYNPYSMCMVVCETRVALVPLRGSPTTFLWGLGQGCPGAFPGSERFGICLVCRSKILVEVGLFGC